MASLRLLIGLYRPAFVLLLACTLAVRLLVPTGYMPAVSGDGVSLTICSGMQPLDANTPVMAGMHHGGEHDGKHKAEAPCPFAAVSQAALGAVPPAMLAAALLFIVLRSLRTTAQRPWASPTRLRPPLRGPPLAI